MTIFVVLPAQAQVLCSTVYRLQNTKVSAPQAKATPNFKSPSIQDIRKHVMAVHITDYLPNGGVIRTSTNSTLSSRNTLHFALGEMVISHAFGNWETKRYAVLVPFQHLEPQLMSVFHQDTYILGNLKLKAGSILIAPKGENIPPMPGVEIVRFDPATEKLRQVIENVLKKNDQWTFQSSGGAPSSKVIFHDENVNGPEFFKSVSRLYPQVKFGLHAAHPIGKIDIELMTSLSALGDSRYHTDRNVEEWTVAIHNLESEIRRLDEIAKTATNQSYLKKHQNLLKLLNDRLNILRAEVQIQEEIDRSLLGTKNLPVEFRQQVIARSQDLTNLVLFLKQNADFLRRADKDYYQNVEQQLSQAQRTMTVEQLTEFLKANPGLAKDGGGIEMLLRFKTVEDYIDDKADVEKKRRAVIALDEGLKACKFGDCWKMVFYAVTPLFENSGSLLSQASVKKNIGRFFDMDFLIAYKANRDFKTVVWMAQELRKIPPERREEFIRRYGADADLELR